MNQLPASVSYPMTDPIPVNVLPIPQRVAVWLLGLTFISAGSMHFIAPAAYLSIMPPYIPFPVAAVVASGVLEIAGGVGVLLPRYRRWAGIGLIALLVAVFPANVHVALHTDLYPATPAWVWFVRLPFQLVFIAWVYWTTQTRPDRNA
jgi:uncharacterized membrane protein